MSPSPLTEAIQRLAPGRSFSVADDSPAQVAFLDQLPGPSLGAIQATISAIQDERAAVAYRALRAAAYPPIGEQLDALFKAGAFPKAMADQIQAVKDQFPKPVTP